MLRVLSALVLMIVTQGLVSARRCVKCSSKQESEAGQCQNDPPPPSACYNIPDPDVTYNCYVMKEYDAENELISVTRDCTTQKEKAMTCASQESDVVALMCHTVCSGEGCNGAGLRTASWLLAFGLLFISAL